MAYFGITFEFSDQNTLLDSVDANTSAQFKAACSALDRVNDAPEEFRRVVEAFYSACISGKCVRLKTPDFGVIELVCSGTLKGEMGKIISRTVNHHGLWAGRELSKRMLVALANLNEIVEKGTTAVCVESRKKRDIGRGIYYSRTKTEAAGQDGIAFTVIFTVKKTPHHQTPYSLNPVGSHSFRLAVTDYLNAVSVTKNKIEFSGEITAPL